MDEQDLDQFKRQVSLSGAVLPGKIGEQHLEREIAQAQQIHARVADYLNLPRKLIKTSIELNSTSLTLELDNLYGDSIINYRAGRLGARHLLDTWVQHLAANMVQPDTSTLFVFRGDKDDAKVSRLSPIDPATAETVLSGLLALYDEGVTSPLFLPPEACRDCY